MESLKKECPKCEGIMKKCSVRSSKPVRLIEGKPKTIFGGEKGWMKGIDLNAYRCGKCGYVEFWTE